MPVRSTMMALISRERDIIGDVLDPGQTPAFSQLQIQDALDRERTDYILGDMYELAGRFSIVSSQYVWTDYLDPYSFGDWEEDVTLYNGGFVLLTPTSSDYLTGHWTFTNQPPPVYLVGKTYDLYAAARNLSYQLISRYATRGGAYDFSADGASFHRSQLVDQLRAQVGTFEALMRIGSATLRRPDVRW